MSGCDWTAVPIVAGQRAARSCRIASSPSTRRSIGAGRGPGVPSISPCTLSSNSWIQPTCDDVLDSVMTIMAVLRGRQLFPPHSLTRRSPILFSLLGDRFERPETRTVRQEAPPGRRLGRYYTEE